jgi:hypothetical protein
VRNSQFFGELFEKNAIKWYIKKDTWLSQEEERRKISWWKKPEKLLINPSNRDFIVKSVDAGSAGKRPRRFPIRIADVK